MNALEIRSTFTVNGKTFDTEAEAQAFIAASNRQAQITQLIKSLEPKASSNPHRHQRTEWAPYEAARHYDENPRTLVLMAAAALHGREPAPLGIPNDLADALAELLQAEQEVG